MALINLNLTGGPADDPEMVTHLKELADTVRDEVRTANPGLFEGSPEFQAAVVTRVSQLLTLSLADISSQENLAALRPSAL